MPAAKPEYCKRTPVAKMGFTQKSSCRAQGLIPRANGTIRKSKKYQTKKKHRGGSKRKRTINRSLFDNGKKKPRTQTGYGTQKRAQMTLRNIKKFPMSYQKQVVYTLYNRAKYHKYQNQGMRNAMRVFSKWIQKH
jgi:hypothetical protein